MVTIQTEKFSKLSFRKEGQGPVIVLIHGFPETGGLWKQVWPMLTASFTVIVPDLPGAGESDLPSVQTSMEVLAESINEILINEGISEAVIVGHSMGGYTAMAFAELYAAKVKGLSLVHSVASADNEEKKETRRKSIELIRKGGKEPFISQMIPNMFSPTFKAAHTSVIEEQVKRGMELAAESMIAYYEAMIARPDRRNVLEKAGFPVQFIIGVDDALIPSEVALQQSSISNRNFVSLYSDTGHMSMIENTARLAEDLNEFGKYCYSH